MGFDDFRELSAFDIAYTDVGGNAPEDVRLRKVVDSVLAEGRALTVAKSRPALDLAKHVTAVKPDLIVVTEPLTGKVSGYVFPNWVVRQVKRHGPGLPADNFLEAVEALINDPELGQRDHFHEWLNFQRPDLAWCQGKGNEGAHLVDDGVVPCARHQ